MMQNQIESLDQAQSLALETAWQRYAQLETNAEAAYKQYLRLRGWVMALAVVATLLAILTSRSDSSLMVSPLGQVLRASLVLVPLIGSVMLVFANRLQQGQYWRVFRTGAQEIRKEIYLYRTLLQGQPQRHQWLLERVSQIQRQVVETIGSNWIIKPYTGEILPDYPGNEPNSVSVLTDLGPDDYLRDRVEAPLKSYSQELENIYQTRTRLQAGILALGALSAFLPALSGSLNIWVAFTTSLGTALIIWLEVSRLDLVVKNYNQLILELNIIRDHWQSLRPPEQTGAEFFKLVIATEKVLWSQHNQDINQMREAVIELRTQPNDMVTQVMSQPVLSKIEQTLLPEKSTQLEILPAKTEVIPEETVEIEVVKPEKQEPKKQNKKDLPHAFVVMPFGRKKGPDGRWIDFNSIYQQLIKPALEEAGFESFRADEESVSGDILTDMFQELLLADLVLTDLSIDNANVYYELGVRHALRKRGLVHIQCGRAYMPYDIFNVRTIPYQCDENGCPDPKHLEKDKQAIVKMARATWESDENRIHSPIFQLLAGLEEPDRRALRTPLATGYWQEYKEWQELVLIAQRQKRIGDVLLLTEEVRNPLIKEEAIADAGKALKNLGNHALALQEYRQGLKINGKNSEFRLEEAFHLSRLKQSEEAIVKLEGLLQDEPNNIKALFYLAGIYTEMWRDEWLKIKNEQERLEEAYEAAHLLRKSIKTYLKAYRLNQDHYHSGISALIYSCVLEHLVEQVDEDSDLEDEAIRQQLPSLKGAVQFTLDSVAQRESNDFWIFVSLADFAVCTAEDPKQVMKAYKKAFTLAGKNKFALKSTLDQLKLLEALSFRPEYVQAGITVIQAELERFEDQEEAVADTTSNEPASVFLFSGHMIDSPNRAQPRFPADMEREARQKIEDVLDKLNACSGSMAIAPGAACGGDILFIEACLERNIKVEVFLTFSQAEFIQDSVSFAGDNWVARFYAIQKHPNVTIHLQPERLGTVPEGDSPYERNNRWALYSTLMYGIERVRLVVLWNGKGGDAPGGTGDMVQQVRQLGGIVEHIDTTKFDYWKMNEKVVEFPKTIEMAGQVQES